VIPLLLLAAALAHENGVSSSRLDVSGRDIRVRFTFSLEDVASLARLDLDRDGLVSREEWGKVYPCLLSYVSGHFEIHCAGERCVPAVGDGAPLPPPLRLAEGRAPVSMEITYHAPREISRLRIRCTLFQEHGGSPRHIAELTGGPVFIFDGDRTESEGAAVRQHGGAIWGGALALFGAGIAALRIAAIRRAGGLRGSEAGMLCANS
jgi:hypothetical protein